MGLSLLERVVEEYGAEFIEQQITKGEFALEWRAIARPEQLAPGTEGSSSLIAIWRHWLALAGRRFGKTRTGAEWVQEECEAGRRLSIALVAPTLNDAWKIMVDGESGLLAISKPELRPTPIRSRRLLVWPNGMKAEIHTSEEPDRLRGRSFDGYWAEELGFWKYPKATWDMLNIALSASGPKGDPPRGFIATTPKGIPLMQQLLKEAAAHDTDMVVSRGSTYENAANLDPDYLRALLRKYEGTRLGDQELHALLLEDAEGALWKTALLEALRLPPFESERARESFLSELRRIVIAVDPAVSSDPAEQVDADRDEGAGGKGETGIVVAGLHGNGKGYVLDDLSGLYTPGEWATVVATAYDEWGADRVIAEKNNGGALVESNMRAHPRGRRMPIKLVWAAKGKFARAEPVAALYEQRQIHHVGRFPLLEQQQTQWEPASTSRSPNRVDALTWAITELMLGSVIPTYRRPKNVPQRRI